MEHNQSNEVLLKVEGVSKKFCVDLKTSLWYGLKDLFSGIMGQNEEASLRPKEFWTLKDINFELRRGECLGLIGHNGAGKSTLLKILNGLINPDQGKVTIRGKVGALIELGAGFNPILSGRENIYINGAVLGFTRQEIDDKLEDIIDFAEIREFIDMPVRNYSSGMKVRLGFAVASQMEPDVLIIDEVLAVGDVSFRAKCFNRMIELRNRCAIIFVSHSMPLIGRICNKCSLLNKGNLENGLNINDCIYKFLLTQKLAIKKTNIGLVLKEFDIELNSDTIFYSEDLIIKLKFILPETIKKFVITYTVLDVEMKSIYQSFSSQDDVIYVNRGMKFQIKIIVEKLDLANGKYFINIGFIDDDYTGKIISRYDAVSEFQVVGGKINIFGAINKPTLWIG